MSLKSCQIWKLTSDEVTLNSMGNFERFLFSVLIFNNSAMNVFLEIFFRRSVKWLLWIALYWSLTQTLTQKYDFWTFSFQQIWGKSHINIWRHILRWYHDVVFKKKKKLTGQRKFVTTVYKPFKLLSFY